MLSLSVAPTLNQLGPIIAVGSAVITTTYTSDDDEALPFVFEVYRNLTIARGTETHHRVQRSPDCRSERRCEPPPRLDRRAGEHARVRVSEDRRTAFGPLVVIRPARSLRGPRFLVQGRYYTEDADFRPGLGAKFAIIWDGNLTRPRDARRSRSERDETLDALLHTDELGS